MEKQIHQYVRKGNKTVGVLMGTKLDNGDVIITASKVAISKGDTFDREFGKELCARRAELFEKENRFPEIPTSMKHQAEDFMQRCMKYFKSEHISFFHAPVVKD